MYGAIRYYFKSEVGHDHGVRDAKNVVGVGRAVEGEDADLRVACVSLRVDGVAPDGEFSHLDAVDAKRHTTLATRRSASSPLMGRPTPTTFSASRTPWS